MQLDILYFAWLRERIGTGEERVDVPDAVATVADLIRWLAERHGGAGSALHDTTRLRAALDGCHVGLDAALAGAREVSLFPPVTGG
jgi:molybdopterin synthase sulfur carrier subunit